MITSGATGLAGSATSADAPPACLTAAISWHLTIAHGCAVVDDFRDISYATKEFAADQLGPPDVGSLATAADQSLTYGYTGYGFDTATDTYPVDTPDGFPVSVTNAVGKGSGVALVAITAEFAPDLLGSVTCPDGYTVPIFLVYSSTVSTFADRSQTTGFSDNGWLCLTGDLTAYVGAVEGYVTGGTGRFAGATGYFESIFDGMNIDPFFGFRTIRGETRATLWTKRPVSSVGPTTRWGLQTETS